MDVYGCMEHEDNATDSADSVLTGYRGCYRTLGIKDFGVLGQESPVQMDCYHRAGAGYALDSPCLANGKQKAVGLLSTAQNLIKCS